MDSRTLSFVDSQTFCLTSAPGRHLLTDAEWERLGTEACLTPREQDVLRLTFEGKTRDSVARSLGVSSRTVRQHMENLHVKLDVHDRVDLVLRVVQVRDELRSLSLLTVASG